MAFINGGQAENIIPETVTFGGSFRSFTSEGLSYLQQRIMEVYLYIRLSNQKQILS